MNFIKRIVLFIKNKLKKQEIKELEPVLNIEKKKEFTQDLKVTSIKPKSKIETLVCEGSGLGILGKISY